MGNEARWGRWWNGGTKNRYCWSNSVRAAVTAADKELSSSLLLLTNPPMSRKFESLLEQSFELTLSFTAAHVRFMFESTNGAHRHLMLTEGG